VISQTGNEWGLATKLVHWSTAVLIVGNIAVGVYLGRILLFSDAAHHGRWLFMMNQHKTIGLIVLLLVPLRAAWTFSRPRPGLPGGMSKPHRTAAKISVASLYLAMLCVPLMGLFLSSFAHAEFKLFGIFDLTSPVARNLPVMATFRTLHQVSAYILLALVATHACAAVTHHFILRDDVLRRMAFGKRETAIGVDDH
jgi:cytochrome b561